jgi:glycosyltransferase involved in cell wall biosynthesis
MKKILIITDNLKEQINGVVTTFKNIEGYANRDGYDIVYLNPGQFHYIDCPGYNEVKLSWPWRIGKKIKKINPEYIHIATEGPLGFAARCWLDARGWKYNTSYHTKFPEFLNHLYNIPEWLTYRYMRWFHKHSGKVLTTTYSMVKDLEDRDFAPGIVAWTRGVDRNIFTPTHREKNEKIILLCVSRISEEKNLEDFCQLEYPNSIKIMIGDGPKKSYLEKKYPDVQFLGIKQGKDLSNYYAMADVFVFPSKTDTFGIVMIEAMACGTPIAAYPVSGPIDIVEPELNGYLSWNLKENIDNCLTLDRDNVYQSSLKWDWKHCWQIFKDNLIKVEN